MEKNEQKFFMVHCEKFDSEEARPSRQIRPRKTRMVNEIIVFDEESFHTTPHKWIALAYTGKTFSIERGDICGMYSMSVNLYEDNKR